MTLTWYSSRFNFGPVRWHAFRLPSFRSAVHHGSMISCPDCSCWTTLISNSFSITSDSLFIGLLAHCWAFKLTWVVIQHVTISITIVFLLYGLMHGRSCFIWTHILLFTYTSGRCVWLNNGRCYVLRRISFGFTPWLDSAMCTLTSGVMVLVLCFYFVHLTIKFLLQPLNVEIMFYLIPLNINSVAEEL